MHLYIQSIFKYNFFSGKLILTSVHSVLIAPQETANHTVYEAMIVNKELFDYDGKGKDYIYLCLSPR